MQRTHALTAAVFPTKSMMDSLDVHLWIAFRNIKLDYKPFQPEAMLQAHEAMIDALADGAITAFGCRPMAVTHGDAAGVMIVPQGVAEMIPAATFATPGILIMTSGMIQLRYREAPKPGSLAELPLYLSIRFRTKDVLSLWPKPSGTLGSDACGEAGQSAQVIPDGTETPAIIPHTSRRHQGTYSKEALSGWFKIRVHAWPSGKRAPSEAECAAAAKEDFDGMPSRSVFRIIRNANTPANWRKQGRRAGI